MRPPHLTELEKPQKTTLTKQTLSGMGYPITRTLTYRVSLSGQRFA